MKKTDYLLVLTIICIAAALHFVLTTNATKDNLVFEIRHGDSVVQTIRRSAMTNSGEFTVNTENGKVQIEIDPTRGACILESPCHDKLCIKQGFINKNGQTLLCLPEKVLITAIAEKKDGEPDAILR